MRSAFNNLKQNAKRRGKIFELTFEDFKKFAIQTDYLGTKGRTKKGFHIDRIDESKGYSLGNIQTITNGQNVRKYFLYEQTKKGPENCYFKKSKAPKNETPF